MIKESILFVVSTGLLIYFVTPSDEPAKVDAAPAETQKPVKQATESADDGWGYDDEDAEDDESFEFGEPFSGSDDDSDDRSSDDEEDGSSDREEKAETREARPKPVAKIRKQYSANSPQPNEQGGVDNPVIFKTDNPANPVDD